MDVRRMHAALGLLVLALLLMTAGSVAAQPSKQQQQHQQVAGEPEGFWSQRIINVDAATILPEHAIYAGAEARFVYSGQVKGVPWDWLSLEAVATLSKEKSITTPWTTLCYGGDSYELRAKGRLYHNEKVCFSIMPGIEMSDTPAQHKQHATAQLLLTHYAASNTQLHFTPKWAFLHDNTIMGLGFGGEFRVHPKVRILGDITPIVMGDNTRDEHGYLARTVVWAFGVRINPCLRHDDWLVDISYGTGKGQTTSYELTPGIFHSKGVSVGACHVW